MIRVRWMWINLYWWDAEYRTLLTVYVAWGWGCLRRWRVWVWPVCRGASCWWGTGSAPAASPRAPPGRAGWPATAACCRAPRRATGARVRHPPWDAPPGPPSATCAHRQKVETRVSKAGKTMVEINNSVIIIIARKYHKSQFFNISLIPSTISQWKERMYSVDKWLHWYSSNGY